MRFLPTCLRASLLLFLLVACAGSGAETEKGPAELDGRQEPEGYYDSKIPSRDGTGKIYMGREIAQVMGHLGAPWLDRPERDQEEDTPKLIEILDPRPGEVIADIGAGSGYFALPLARRVLPGGKVLAVDIQPEMLTLLGERVQSEGLDNVELILGQEQDPRLPAGSVDKILLVDVYHEFSHPFEMARAMAESLAPGGRIYFVEYRAEDPRVPIKPLHKMSEAQVRREMEPHPLRWVETVSSLPRQHVVVFTREEGP